MFCQFSRTQPRKSEDIADEHERTIVVAPVAAEDARHTVERPGVAGIAIILIADASALHLNHGLRSERPCTEEQRVDLARNLHATLSPDLEL